MPRPKRPPTLQVLSVNRLVNFVLESCCLEQDFSFGCDRHVEDIVELIPNSVANEYMKALVQQHKTFRHMGADFSQAICSRCTHLTLSERDNEYTVRFMLDNLWRISGLTHFRVRICLGEDADRAKLIVASLPYLSRLRFLSLELFDVTDDANLIRSLAYHCPLLTNLQFQWGLSQNQPVTLAACCNLQRVTILYPGTSASDVHYILDTVPQLDYLIMGRQLLIPLLQQCKGPYRLRSLDFCDPKYSLENEDWAWISRIVVGTQHLDSVARAFPYLEELDVDKCGDLSLLRPFQHLKKLSVLESTVQQLLCISDAFVNLTDLTLLDIDEMDVAFRSIGDDALPNLLELSLVECGGIDLVQIGSLLTHLEHLEVINCVLKPCLDSHYSSRQPFRHLTYLAIIDMFNSFRSTHLSYVTRHCLDIQELTLLQDRTLEDSVLRKVLRVNPMSKLRHLHVEGNCLTPMILSVVFKFFGPELSDVYFNGQVLNQYLNPDLINHLKEMLAPNDIVVRLGDLRI